MCLLSHSSVKDGGDFYFVSFELWTDVRHSWLIVFFLGASLASKAPQ